MCRCRRRGLEDIAVDAAVSEQAVVALLSLEGADYLFEGVAEAAPEGGALVLRQAGFLKGDDMELIAMRGEIHCQASGK